jgi:hypothetical protein
MVTVLPKSETFAMLASHHLEWDLPNEMVNVNLGEGEVHALIYSNETRRYNPTDVTVYIDKRRGDDEKEKTEIANHILSKYGWVNMHFYRTSITNPTLRFIIQNHNKKVLG